MTDVAWHALAVVSFLLVGVPSNVAVLWIHTRKNSRVAKNRFPLLFAAIDLFALVTNLPFQHFAFERRGAPASDDVINVYINITVMFAINGYLQMLFMATFDKFYAVIFPIKYGKKRATIFRTAIFILLVPNAVLAFALATIYETLGRQAFLIINLIYVVIILVMFLTITIFYFIIIAKIISNQRNLSKVNDNRYDCYFFN